MSIKVGVGNNQDQVQGQDLDLDFLIQSIKQEFLFGLCYCLQQGFRYLVITLVTVEVFTDVFNRVINRQFNLFHHFNAFIR